MSASASSKENNLVPLGAGIRKGPSPNYSSMISPFIVFRSEKYSYSVRSRVLLYVANARRMAAAAHVISPLGRRVLFTLLDWLGELVLIALTLPLGLVIYFVVAACRRIEKQVVRRRSTKPLTVVNDESRCPFSSNDGLNDVVTSLVWVREQFDLASVSSLIEESLGSGLHRLCQVPKKHVTFYSWEEDESFRIEDHLTQASSKFLGSLINDEPLRDLSGYSVLQKYISKIASTPLPVDRSPWHITLIQIPGHKPVTVICLQFHRLLLKDAGIIKMFISSLNQEGHDHCHVQETTATASLFEREGERDMNFNSRKEDNNLSSAMKQQHRHYWSTFEKPIFRFLISLLMKGIEYARRLLLFLFAVFHLPRLVMRAFIIHPENFGLERKRMIGDGENFEVSWSKQVNCSFVQDISKQHGEHTSEEAVILTAIGMALRDYYHENCISNPQKLGVVISSNSELKNVQLPTINGNISSQIRMLNECLNDFPSSRTLALSMLPNLPFSSPILRGIEDHYPINVTFINADRNTNSSSSEASSLPLALPYLTLWGKSVQEYTFWKGSKSSVSISVVKYAGTLRLSVLSPMKSVDSFISLRFTQYLNQIAEAVGLDRSKIPYSRRSSPLSSPGGEALRKPFTIRISSFRKPSPQNSSCFNVKKEEISRN